jgi:hypothetical protein
MVKEEQSPLPVSSTVGWEYLVSSRNAILWPLLAFFVDFLFV